MLRPMPVAGAVGLVALLLTAACASLEPPPPPPSGTPRLDDQQIRSTLTGARGLVDADPKGHGRYVLGPNQSVSVTAEGVMLDGKWSVEAGQLCMAFSGSDKMCGDVYRLDEQRIYVLMPGWTREFATLTVQR